WLGVTALTVTTLLVTVVTAWAADPSENVAVTVSVLPGANPMPPLYSDANSVRLPPSATAAFTAIVVALFSTAPSSEGSTPSTQAAFGVVVSHVRSDAHASELEVRVHLVSRLRVGKMVAPCAPSRQRKSSLP